MVENNMEDHSLKEILLTCCDYERLKKQIGPMKIMNFKSDKVKLYT